MASCDSNAKHLLVMLTNRDNVKIIDIYHATEIKKQDIALMLPIR